MLNTVWIETPGGGMRRVQINKRHQAASGRRQQEREQILPLDPRDPDIARARARLRSTTVVDHDRQRG
jgi:hypothetical protein